MDQMHKEHNYTGENWNLACSLQMVSLKFSLFEDQIPTVI